MKPPVCVKGRAGDLFLIFEITICDLKLEVTNCDLKTAGFIAKSMQSDLIPPERIESKIYLIRGRKVMLDSDLAVLYQVRTDAINQAVRRNLLRFPEEFSFFLTAEEHQFLLTQIVLAKGRGGRRSEPRVFTEQGVAMLSCVLKSERAVSVSIQIIRTFTKLREMLLENDYLRRKIEAMEKQYDQNFKVVFNAIRGLLKEKDEPAEEIGFKSEKT